MWLHGDREKRWREEESAERCVRAGDSLLAALSGSSVGGVAVRLGLWAREAVGIAIEAGKNASPLLACFSSQKSRAGLWSSRRARLLALGPERNGVKRVEPRWDKDVVGGMAVAMPEERTAPLALRAGRSG